MTDKLDPVPDGETRSNMALRVRTEATQVSNKRAPGATVTNNGEAESSLNGPDADMILAAGTFTKGLEHDDMGFVSRGHLRALVSEINQDKPGSMLGETPLPGTYGSGLAAEFDVPQASGTYSWPNSGGPRSWESPLTGHTFDLEGADAGQVAMPEAPRIGSDELIAEMAEVYGMALMRDVPFEDWASDAANGGKVQTVIDALNGLAFFQSAHDGDAAAKRRKARLNGSAAVDPGNLFRGSTPGAQKGPYISQFLLIGNKERAGNAARSGQRSGMVSSADALNRAAAFVPTALRGAAAATAADGYVRYGIQAIPQYYRPHEEGRDHMTDWQSWLDVQRGANRKDAWDIFLGDDGMTHPGQTAPAPRERFISTPRDLATYVHFDALYQAYLNACLLLLGMQAPSDVGLPEGGKNKTRDGFATFGGPHILTLVTEVATRALKAVRRQKYQAHLRARPEAVAGAITLAWNAAAKPSIAAALGAEKADLDTMVTALDSVGLLRKIADHNTAQNKIWGDDNWPVENDPLTGDDLALLPMAFPEGSPMHPAYGAGHATVAGACVTVLKAFFEMFKVTDNSLFKGGQIVNGGLDIRQVMQDPNAARTKLFGPELYLTGPNGVSAGDKGGPEEVYVSDHTASDPKLKTWPGYASGSNDLTIQGELDKLAANISVGRNFAGVHYYTDYYESLRMGERIAISILQEQMLTYREPVSMRLTTFDGDQMLLIGTGGSRDFDDAPVLVWDRAGAAVTFGDWWTRHHS